jgi:hypothetical protein
LFEHSTLRQQNLVLLKICSIAFVTSTTDALEPYAALPSLTQFASVFHLPASLNAFQLSPSTRVIIVDFFDGQAMSPECHLPEPEGKKSLDYMGRKSSTSWMHTNVVGPNSGKTLQSNDLPTEFFKRR